MTPERWQKVERVLDRVLEHDPAEWTALLDEACDGDDQLRREVHTLLRRYTQAGKDLRAPTRPMEGLLDPRVEERDLEDRRIGPYRMIRPLGHGGMGAVYLAERADGQYEQQVALKLLRLGGSARKNEVQRFRAERQILAGLQHPNIARLLDGGVTDDGQPYLVMEYVEGQSIDRYCDAHRLPVDARLRLFRTVCEAVQQAHRQGIVHRDLKPGNILVTGEGTVKLLDFGIAEVLDEERAPPITLPVTRTGVPLMTPEYAAPEQVSGDEIAATTDVYQLGAVLYELLTGRRLFEFESYRPSEVERTIREERPEKPSDAVARRRAERGEDDDASTRGGPRKVGQARGTSVASLKATLRGDLDTILMKALRKEPARRYASAEALAEDLSRYAEGLPVRAQKAGWTYRARKYVSRHRWSVGATAFVLLLLMAYAATVTVQAQRIAHERDQAQAEAAKAKRTTTFLTNLFEETNPANGREERSTVENLLDMGAARVKNTLTAQPDVQVRLMNIMGNAYRNRGSYKEALALQQQALALAQKRESEAPTRRIADLQNNIGEALYYLGRYEEAAQHYQRALTLRRDLLGRAHVEVAQTLHNLALVDLGLGRLSRAERRARKAIVTFKSALDGGHWRIANARNVLGRILRARGKLRKAQTLHERAMAMHRKLQGEKRFAAAHAIAQNDLGLTLRRRGRAEAAEQEHRRALADFHRLLPANHPFIGRALTGLARALHTQGRYDDAERFYQQAIDHQRQALPSTHPRRAGAMIGMGRLLLEADRRTEADSLLRRGLRLRKQGLPAGHPSIARAKQFLPASS
jgi:serine/threonine-protein kinase